VPSTIMFPSEHTMYTWQFSRSNECNVIWFISKVKFGQQRKKSKILLTVILRSKAYSDTSLSDRYKRLRLGVVVIRCTLRDSTDFPRFCVKNSDQNIDSHKQKDQIVSRNWSIWPNIFCLTLKKSFHIQNRGLPVIWSSKLG